MPAGTTYVSPTGQLGQDARGRTTFEPPPGGKQPPGAGPFGSTFGEPVNQTFPAVPGDYIQIIVPPQNKAESGGIFNKQLKCPKDCDGE